MTKIELQGIDAPVVVEVLGDRRYKIGSDEFIVQPGTDFVARETPSGTSQISHWGLKLEYGDAVADFFLRESEKDI